MKTKHRMILFRGEYWHVPFKGDIVRAYPMKKKPNFPLDIWPGYIWLRRHHKYTVVGKNVILKFDPAPKIKRRSFP